MQTPERPASPPWIAIGTMVAVPAVAFVVVLFASGGEDEKDDPKDDTPSSETLTQAPSPAENARPPRERFEAMDRPGPAPGPDTTALEPEQPMDTADPENPESVTAPSEVAAKLDEARAVENTEPDRARQLLRDVLQVDPNNVPALRSLSTKLLIDENHEEAARLAKRCQGLEESDPTCEQVGDLAVEMTADVERLAGATRRCLVDEPGNVECLGGMVNYHLAKGENSDAALYLGRLSQANPEAPQTLYASGRLQAAGGEYEEAARLFRAACVDLNYQPACFRSEALTAEGW